jgi:serine/threonine-protein phosphatase 2A regulatory subunit A
MANLDIDPLEVLREDLKDDSVEVQLEAINGLETIALALGHERTANELFAILDKYCFPVEVQAAKSPEAYSNTESLSAKEEVLAAIAEKLGSSKFIDYAGGSKPASQHMLPLLEKLAMVEETVIRNAAVISLNKVFDKLKADDVKQHGIGILTRLATPGEWFTSRISASAITAKLYRILTSDDDRKMILEVHKKLCNDDMPMVKHDAYKNLVDLLDEMNCDIIISYVKPLLDQLNNELMENMRQCLIDIIKKIAEKMYKAQHNNKEPPHKKYLLQHYNNINKGNDDDDNNNNNDNADHDNDNNNNDDNNNNNGIDEKSTEMIVEYIEKSVKDSSWRVRKHVAEELASLCIYLKKSMVNDTMCGLYMKLLQDNEPQVRKCSILTLDIMLKSSNGNLFALQMMNNVLSSLANDSQSEVREALAEKISCLGEYLDKNQSKEKLLPILKNLASDESAQARLNLCSHLSLVCSILGIETFESEILPLLKEVTIDQKWRVRNSIVKNIAKIGIQMGKDKYQKSRLKDILIQSLKDPAFTVRNTAIDQIQILYGHFGYEWMSKNIFGDLKKMYKESGNYLHRMVPLKAISLLSTNLSNKEMKQEFADILLLSLDDNISNVRFLACRVIQNIIPKIDNDFITMLKVKLTKLSNDDTDQDVVYFAKQALQSM